MRTQAQRPKERVATTPGRTDVGNWQRVLDRHIWFLRRAGIPEAQIARQITLSMRRHGRTRPVSMPSHKELNYSDVLAQWQNDAAYLDRRKRPLPVPTEGPAPSFYSLVRATLPTADPAKVLAVLLRYGLVSRNPDGFVRLLRRVFIPRGRQRGSAVSICLQMIEALTDTCWDNLHGKELARVQRLAYTEHFDSRFLRAYDDYMRTTSEAFLDSHEAWVRRHKLRMTGERRGRRGRTRRVWRVGIGVFGSVTAMVPSG
jgi:hypothetical protein